MKIKRKFLPMLLTLMMVLSIIPTTAHAKGIDQNNSTDIIPQNVAEIIASYFLRDSISLPDISWISDTEISACEIMYGIDNDVSAYSFELTTDGNDTGYIIISAYPDVPNVILEFSDKSAPVYDLLDLQSGDTIVYTGLLNYYKDNGSELLTTIESEEISLSDVPTPLEATRSLSNLRSVSTRSKYPIDDPYEWADTYYEGPFVYGGDSINEFENHCNFRTTKNFSGYDNHCGPTAITNLIEMIGSYEDYSTINNDTYKEIFENVVNYGIENDYFSNSNGSPWETLNSFIEGSFGLYDVNVTVSSKTATFSNIKTELTNHRPFYLTLKDHPEYGNHGVAAYAYTRLQSESTGYYLSFVKIADGWENYGRYLDITSLDESDQAELRAIK